MRQPLHTGITMPPPYPGLVPQLEEREAARFAAIPWTEWERMERSERARVVAHHRLHNMIEMHVSDAAREVVERQSKRRGR